MSMCTNPCQLGVAGDACLGSEESILAQEEPLEGSRELSQSILKYYSNSSEEDQFYLSMGTMDDDDHRHHNTFKADCTHCLEAKMREKRANKGAATKERPLVTANLDCALVSELDINDTKADLGVL